MFTVKLWIFGHSVCPLYPLPVAFSDENELEINMADGVGVTLYCMLTGKLPFNVENPIDLFDAVRLQQ